MVVGRVKGIEGTKDLGSSPASACALLWPGPPLEEAPAVLDKPDVVYVVEGQPTSVTVTFNHVEAQVIWRRWGPAWHASLPTCGYPTLAIRA